MHLPDALKARPQYLLPGHLLSRLMYGLTRIRFAPFKNLFIDTFIRLYRVRMDEAVEPRAHAYEHFNAFFTRAVRPETRPVVEGARAVACPVDGTVSQAGEIDDDTIFQAKGHRYTVTELLGGDPKRAEAFRGGHFATLYLAPSNYHRIHMPLEGRLTEMVHVPGRLFSVNPATARTIPRLFARNERVAALFETPYGPMAVVLVGAIFVASIETVWAGQVTPPAGRVVRRWAYGDKTAPRFEKGEEIGRFNMGSTVIVLFGPEAVSWAGAIRHGAGVCMGQHLADLVGRRKPVKKPTPRKAVAARKTTPTKKAAPKKAAPKKKAAAPKKRSTESGKRKPSQAADQEPHRSETQTPMLEESQPPEEAPMETSKWKRPRPEEPEHVSCEVCLKEIPASTAHTAEGPEYIYHFCGIECLDKWKAKARHEEGPLDHPKDV